MMRNTYVMSGILIFSLLLAIFVYMLHNVKTTVNLAGNANVNTSITTPVGNTGQNASIRVDSPQPYDEVTSPLVATGAARVFEGVLSYRLKDANNLVLVEKSVTIGGPEYGSYTPYTLYIPYSTPKTAAGILEVFEISAKDGTEVNKVIVPVHFSN